MAGNGPRPQPFRHIFDRQQDQAWTPAFAQQFAAVYKQMSQPDCREGLVDLHIVEGYPVGNQTIKQGAHLGLFPPAFRHIKD